MNNKVLLTGATGFVGGVLLSKLPLCQLKVLGRTKPIGFEGDFFNLSISPEVDFKSALSEVKTVIHCAARTHVMIEYAVNPLVEYRRVNVDGTLKLARQAAEAGVDRFIFISSIKVNGESTTGSRPYSPNDDFLAEDAYGLSKVEAEEELSKLAKETDMEVVIIRPPLVYGPGVKANFLNLIKLSNTVFPLPFSMIKNQRSMVYIENLIDFIIMCIDHRNAANQTFIVSDGRDLSLPELITLLRSALGRSACLIPVPSGVFKICGFCFRNEGLIDRLIGSLQVDSSKAKELLGWKPPFTIEQGIQATIDDYLKRNN